MDPVDVRFEFERETNGALRYAELNHLGQRIRRLDDGIIGTLYIRKRASREHLGLSGSPSILTKNET